MGFSLGGGLIGTVLGGSVGSVVGGASGKNATGGFNYKGQAIPSFDMKKTTDFYQNNPNIQVGGPDASSAMTKRFNSLRDATNNQANAASGTASDAIKRRFASMGASGSGAQVKLEQQALDKNEEQRQNALSNVNNQETETIANRDLAQANMDFQNRVFNFNQASKMHELDLQERQQKIDSVTGEYNKQLSQFQAQPPPQGLISSVIGGLI